MDRILMVNASRVVPHYRCHCTPGTVGVVVMRTICVMLYYILHYCLLLCNNMVYRILAEDISRRLLIKKVIDSLFFNCTGNRELA